ncbi:MAG: UDP-2,3-diacylglucosamine diphosphatase [Planctomycetota bacterium]|nr:MAG: UDP-2,3-diacylglucosamine diphosphatase [Planctomycetota bacterium]
MARRSELARIELPRVELQTPALVIADLHLDLDDARSCAEFTDWLAAQRGARALVILGDLFEYWLGAPHLEHAGGKAICAALARFARERGPVHVLHGNRDFLLDARFEAASGARVHPFGLRASCAGSEYLFLHGDELCIHDHAYQRLRRVIRSRPVRALARVLPRPALERAARRLRRRSVAAVAAKAPLDVEQVASVGWQWLEETGARELVVGHAHRWREERDADGRRLRVLDAWGGPRAVLAL